MVGSIEESARAENTDTKYRLGIATRIPYTIRRRDEAPAYLSWLYVRISAYSSNALIFGSVNSYVINRGDSRRPIALGSLVSRIVAANYGSSRRSNLDTWRLVTDFDEWRMAYA